MLKEGAYAEVEPDSNESIEQIKSPEIPDENYGELLLSGDLAGEGGRAVIVKLSRDNVAENLRPAYKSLSLDREAEEKAVKVFKLYLPNKGKNEYEIHSRMQRMIEELPDDQKNEFARVPTLSSSRDISLTPDMRHKLEEHFQLSSLGERSILITMEYIDGEDLATIFYKWILEHKSDDAQRMVIPSYKTDMMSFGELYIALAKKLNLESPPEGIDAPQEVLERAEWKVSQRNADKIYSYLRKYNFPMPPQVASRLENTLKLMHKGRMTHGDAFERNIMLTGGSKALREKGTLEGEDTFLIDFGESRDHFVESVDDFNVVRRLKTLSLSRDQEIQLAKSKEFEDINTKAELIKGNGKWRQTYEAIKKQAKSDPEKAIISAWNNTAILKESGVEDFSIIVRGLIEEGLVQKAIAADFLKEKGKEKMTPFRKNLLAKCAEWLNIDA
jgi:serine/threonine protein kinase